MAGRRTAKTGTLPGYSQGLREIRGRLGVSQKVFGDLLGGYSVDQIARYEQGRNEPSLGFWRKAARTFGVNLNWIIGGTGTPGTTVFDHTDERKLYYQWDYLRHKEVELAQRQLSEANNGKGGPSKN